MKPYEIMEHTADAQFRAYGATLEEAFGNAVTAMAAIITDPASAERDREIGVSVHANDLKRLLFELLDQTLFLMDTEKFLAVGVGDIAITQAHERFTLTATLVGDDIRKHGGNLKAVTYSDMKVEELPDGMWMLQAVIDI
jgi:SHS2 domain-containing protein